MPTATAFTHETWREFTDRLNGPDGCNFTQKVPGDASTTEWFCGHDHTKARRIMAEMGFTLKQIDHAILRFEDSGGYCDCEILFNVRTPWAGLVTKAISCRDVALVLRRSALSDPRQARLELGITGWNLDAVEDDHNDNEWRAEDSQAVNFRWTLRGHEAGDREFLVTVEDITVNED